MAALDSGLKTSLTAMAKIAILRRPGDFPVVARPAILSLTNLVHRDVVAACLHLETEVDVTN